MSAPWSVRERAFSRKLSLKDSICSRKVGKNRGRGRGGGKEKTQTGEGGDREEMMLWGVEMRRAEG